MLSQKYMKPGSCDNLQILFKKTRFITYSPIIAKMLTMIFIVLRLIYE